MSSNNINETGNNPPQTVPVYEHQVMYTAQAYAPPPAPFTPVVPAPSFQPQPGTFCL